MNNDIYIFKEEEIKKLKFLDQHLYPLVGIILNSIYTNGNGEKYIKVKE